MSEEIQDEEWYDLLSVIDTQCSLILSVMDIEANLYDDMEEDKIKCISDSFRVIGQANKNLFKLLKKT